MGCKVSWNWYAIIAWYNRHGEIQSYILIEAIVHAVIVTLDIRLRGWSMASRDICIQNFSDFLLTHRPGQHDQSYSVWASKIISSIACITELTYLLRQYPTSYQEKAWQSGQSLLKLQNKGQDSALHSLLSQSLPLFTQSKCRLCPITETPHKSSGSSQRSCSYMRPLRRRLHARTFPLSLTSAWGCCVPKHSSKKVWQKVI